MFIHEDAAEILQEYTRTKYRIDTLHPSSSLSIKHEHCAVAVNLEDIYSSFAYIEKIIRIIRVVQSREESGSICVSKVDKETGIFLSIFLPVRFLQVPSKFNNGVIPGLPFVLFSR